MVTAIVLAAIFFALYLMIGEAYRRLPGYADHSNIFFGADHLDALQGWVSNHKGVHPLLLLVVVPMSAMLGWIFGSYEGGLTILAAGLGALTVGLFFVLARGLGGRPRVAAGATVVFGLSMSQLVFGCIPESYSLATVGLITTFLLTLWCLREQRLHPMLWIAAGLLSFGVTITNALQTFICLCVVLGSGIERGRRLRLLITLPLIVVGVSVVLALVQRAIFPEARLFFQAAPYAHEFHYLTTDLFDEPGSVVSEILKNFFVFNFVGQWPEVVVFEPGRRLMMIYAGASVHVALLPIAAVLLWIGLLVRGATLAIRDVRARPIVLAACLWVLAGMLFHAFYSTDEAFLFTPHFTFALVLMALGERATGGRWVAAAWWTLAVLIGANNLWLVARIVQRFGI